MSEIEYIEQHNVGFGSCLVIGHYSNSMLMVDCGSMNNKVNNTPFKSIVDNISERYQDMTSIFDKTGTLIFAGKTLNNKRNGIGISYNSKKDKVLVGKWKNGLFTGNGTIFDFDGNVLLAGQISSEMLLEFNIHEKNV